MSFETVEIKMAALSAKRFMWWYLSRKLARGLRDFHATASLQGLAFARVA